MEGALPGVFSVGESKHVYFSRGNAQYNDDPRFAQFAEHQYDFVGDATQGTVYYNGVKSDNNKCDRLYKGWIDLFEWGGEMTQNSARYVYDTFWGYKEWGRWGYQNGGYPKTGLWRTLTSDEWIYLFDKRTNAAKLRGQATVNNMHGYVILADDWQLPAGLTFKPQPNNWTTNTYSAQEWKKMEDAGAVFLPAAGVRNGKQIQGIGLVGAYWSSTMYQQQGEGEVDAQCIYFTGDNANANMYDTWHRGMSVRLVHDIDYVEPPKPKSAWDEEMERQKAQVEAKPQADKTETNTIAINGALPGWFSIAPDQQARFAQGNVQYKPSTNTWRFAEHQYDFVGNDDQGNVYIGSTKCDNTKISLKAYDGWLDMFCWGTGKKPTEYKMFPSLYQQFVDWGGNPFINGGNANNIWRTLTGAEWKYLFDERPNATRLRGQAVVNDVKGYILLPDNWQLPAGVTFKPEPENLTTNVYNLDQWSKLEKAGAVFLPSTDYRSSTGLPTVSSYGYYWASDWIDQEEDEAACMWFCYNGSSGNGKFDVYYGIGVRLIQDQQLAAKAKQPGQESTTISEQQVATMANLPEVEPESEWKLYEDMYEVGDINPREGFRRIKINDTTSFAYFLRHYKLKDDWNLYYYNGQPVKNQFGCYAVLDIEVGTRDLLQCADAVMLLRAEYLYSQKRYNEIHFNSVAGKRMNYVDYVKGDYSRAKFRKYMDYVFAYASTLSLEKELKPRAIEDIQIGDVFIVGGSPGHAMIVVDMAINAKGERALLMAQGMMPAQSVHVTTNLEHGEDTPWYLIDKYLEWSTLFIFPNYAFSTSELKCFE